MKENIFLECPFCGKKKIFATYMPSILQTKVSRAANRTVTKFYQTKEKYEVQSSCPNCGKSAKEIQKAFDEGKKDPEKEKRILKRLKEQGFPEEITTKF